MVPNSFFVLWRQNMEKEDPDYSNITFYMDDVNLGRYAKSIINKTIKFKEWSNIKNQELRRVVISRMGVEWMVKNGNPNIIDVDDSNINGHRALLGIGNIAILECGDPSTGRVYFMEVPPAITTCQEADKYLSGGQDQNRQVGRT